MRKNKRNKVKVAILATVVGYGGAEKVVLTQIENINNDQFELVPIIFTSREQINNVFFQKLDQSREKYHKFFVTNYRIKYLNPLANFIEAYQLFKKGDFDLIHTHGYRTDVLGVLLSKLTGLPIITTCHGFISNDSKLKIYNTLDRIVLRFSNKIIAVSDGIKNNLIESGINESRIIVIQNAVNGNYNDKLFAQNRQKKRQTFNITEKEFVLGYIGRLSEEKGIKYLIEACSMLNKLDVHVKLLIIGEGPQKKKLEDLVRERGIERKVIFTGFQNHIENWLPAMDVFVLPSLTEGTPMALLEAMAYGIPVVASAVGGVPDVINSGKNGILISPGKSEEIKDAVLNIYRDKSLRNSFSKAAQKTIKLKYNIKDWISKIEAQYLNILKKA